MSVWTSSLRLGGRGLLTGPASPRSHSLLRLGGGRDVDDGPDHPPVTTYRHPRPR
jgi:hypothetical protein